MTARTTRRSSAASRAGNETASNTSTPVRAASRAGTATRQRDGQPVRASANTSRKRKADVAGNKHVKFEEDVKDEGNTDSQPTESKPRTKRSKGSRATAPGSDKLESGANMAESWMKVRDDQRDEDSPTKRQRAQNNPYGLSPGESPFPSYQHPSPAECHEVRRILAKAHGDVAAPKTIPTPSLNSSGCGEVPSVLDALIRTRLSAATNNANSSRAFRGLVETFGIIKEGVGKGSVDWNKVRQAPLKQVFEAIQSGGLADVKSRDIQKILNMVHAENQERKAMLSGDGGAAKQGDSDEPAEEKQEEIKKASSDVITLDHVHLLDNDTAFNKLLGYPGVGPKTASCVLLFCMQRPSFAVDTHVFRLTRWLGWVPTDSQARSMVKRGESKSAQVTRNSTYAHLDVRIPDELKYPLHYLLIKHGKNCGWCSAKAGKDRKVGTCPLAGLMKGKGRSKGLAKAGQASDEGEDAGEDDDEDGSVKDEDDE